MQKDKSDNESDAIDIDQCDNEESKEKVNKTEFSGSEDEGLQYIAPSKKRARVISDFETESDLNVIDTSDKEISAEKAADGTLWGNIEQR
ncbi:hypothetical protein TNIN_238231 [Trichonephila inaurata madagascariensis]|uniref:Uncharacterized protein n=1 Tax=Trichonephila inaurata madagascariensis TaxID=2747483 RepID=A0A8X6XVF2_9ARAC|nr:hypothetical protein TNIN_238231 [Trichonephila inaurata madagascariensis]